MKPRVILHNSVSLNGSLTGFEVNMGLHYQLAGSYEPQAHLIGSNTVLMGAELYGEGVPPEEPQDFIKPLRDPHVPLWAVIDSGGKLAGMLHTCRRFEYCRDVIVFVSEDTPPGYLLHLQERNYDAFIAGKKKVDLKIAMEVLAEQYQVKTVLVDTGRILGNLLLKKGLVDEISMLIHPELVGKRSYTMFGNFPENIGLQLIKEETLEMEYVWLRYGVVNL
ncbi:MAG TPA: dihydrofolate reductase family protein [Bacteroidales bacterium]|nr:dihydrofolate reductase family protein [Bacteroidales bacterium]HRZ21072.1 dihydrofolate reductase family protein [Bacteroidales bacterium]